jgi:hypothetical protein
VNRVASSQAPQLAARELLDQQLLIHVSVADNAATAAGPIAELAREAGAVLVASGNSARKAHALRGEFPDVPVAWDRESYRRVTATRANPFELPEPDLFGSWTLERWVAAELDRGAPFAITPTGHISAGDTDSVKAIISEANRLDDVRVLVHLPLHWRWCRPDTVDRVARLLTHARHPVAISLAHNTDPLSESRVAESLGELAARTPSLVLLRSDLAALDVLARGGLSGAFGVTATLRHGLATGKTGMKINPADLGPHVFFPDLLRFLRSSFAADLYANHQAPACSCLTCKGRRLDGFTSSPIDKSAAAEHNVRHVITMFGELVGHRDRLERAEWWRSRTREAVVAHEILGQQLGRPMEPPTALRCWAGC